MLRVQQLGLQTIAEGTALGLFFAVWWRITHTQEKAKVDKFYAELRSAVAVDADDDPPVQEWKP